MKKYINLNSGGPEAYMFLLGLILSPSIVLILISCINLIKQFKKNEDDSSNQKSHILGTVFIALGIIFNGLLIYNICDTGLTGRIRLLAIGLGSIIHGILLHKQKGTRGLTILNILIRIIILIISIMYYTYQ